MDLKNIFKKIIYWLGDISVGFTFFIIIMAVCSVLKDVIKSLGIILWEYPYVLITSTLFNNIDSRLFQIVFILFFGYGGFRIFEFIKRLVFRGGKND